MKGIYEKNLYIKKGPNYSTKRREIMKKTELLKLVCITLTFTVLIVSAFTVIGFADYPGPDEDNDSDNGIFEGVSATAIGTYAWGYYDVYQNCEHWGSRWVSWPSEYDSDLYVHFYSSEYDIDYWSQEDSEGGGGVNVWADYITSHAYAEFSNIYTGGNWDRSATASVEAMP